MTIKYERVLVTPELAFKWLRQNAENNRKPKAGKIPQYARDMQAGNWKLTGETIKFTPDGTLIDGQNRLRAVTVANCAVEFDVAYDVPKESMGVIDTGAARTFSDVLAIGGSPNRMNVSAVVRWVILWDGGIRLGQGSAVAPTHSEMMARYESDHGAFDAAGARGADCSRLGLGTSSAMGTGFYLTARIDRVSAHDFFDQYVTGANLAETSPVLKLRNRMLRMRVDRIKRPEQLALLIRAWNLFRKGDEVKGNLVISRDGTLTNANFPVPK